MSTTPARYAHGAGYQLDRIESHSDDQVGRVQHRPFDRRPGHHARVEVGAIADDAPRLVRGEDRHAGTAAELRQRVRHFVSHGAPVRPRADAGDDDGAPRLAENVTHVSEVASGLANGQWGQGARRRRRIEVDVNGSRPRAEDTSDDRTWQLV